MMDKLGPIKSKIQEIYTDNRSGAVELTKKAADVFTSFSKIKVSREKEFLPLLYQISRNIVRSQPSMAPIINLVNRILLKVEELSDIKKIQTKQSRQKHRAS
jgi:hypothetical protein